MSIYIRYQGRKQGPLSEAQLATLLSRGTVSKETEASLDEENWQPLGSLPVFEKLYKQTVGQTAQMPYVYSVAETPNTKQGKNDIFAIAESSRNDFDKKPVPSADTIQRKKSAIPPPKTVPEITPFISSLQENPKLLYGIGGGAFVVIFLLIVAVIFIFGSAVSNDKETASVNEPASQQQKEQTEAEAKAAAEQAEKDKKEAKAKAAAEKAEKDKKEAEAKAAAEKAEKDKKEAEAKAAAEQAEKDKKEAEVKAAAEKAEQAKIETEAKVAEKERLKTLDAELVKTVDSLDETFPLKPLFLGVSGAVQRPESIDSKFAGLRQPGERLSFRYISYVPKRIFSIKNVSPLEIVISYNNDDVFRLFLDENGLHSQWLDVPSITPESFRILNGITLSELEIVQITNQKTLKTISLFKPIEYQDTFRLSSKQISLTDCDYDFNALGFSKDQFKITDIRGVRPSFQCKTLTEDSFQFQFRDETDNYQIRVRVIPQALKQDKNGEWKIPITEQVTSNVFTDYQERLNDYARLIRESYSKQEKSKLTAKKDRILSEYQGVLGRATRIYAGEPMMLSIMIPHPTTPKRRLKLFSIKEPDKGTAIAEPADDDMKTDDDKNESENTNERSFLNTNKK